MSNDLMKLKSIRKSFGDLLVLQGIDHTFKKGTITSIIGPSGSGKSTLIRCLNHLESFEGSYEYKNQETNTEDFPKTKFRTNFGMVFQHFNLFPHMNVLNNVIEAPVHVQKTSKKLAIENARKLLEKVGLSDKVEQFPNNLSGGQKQRVAIARALALNPEVLLFDEPTSALDPEMVGEVLSVIRQLKTDSLTMVIVTHEMEFAREISDDIIFLDKGEVVECGPPDRIFTAPKTERLKSFLSGMEI